MRKEEFISEIVDYCELDGGPFLLQTELESIEGYDSLAILSIIAYVDEKFSVKISGEQFARMTDFDSLINEIGGERFEDI
jgi:acyl carrier protein